MATFTNITATPATEGPAVAAKFLKVGEQVKVGAVLTVREVLVVKTEMRPGMVPGTVYLVCTDVEGQEVNVTVPVGTMVQLHDQVAADEVMRAALVAMGAQ